jgi:hypothetical protein
METKYLVKSKEKDQGITLKNNFKKFAVFSTVPFALMLGNVGLRTGLEHVRSS